MRRQLPFLVLAIYLSLPSMAAAQDASGPVGTWYLRSNQSPVTATITAGAKPGTVEGTLIDEKGIAQALDEIQWDAKERRLEFRRAGKGWWQWYRGTITEGIFAGRFSQEVEAARPAKLTAYSNHATGWNSTYLDKSITPRVFNVLLADQYRAWLRVDSSSDVPKKFIGRLRVYATVKGKAAGEELEYDIDVTKWDGKDLEFVRRDPAWTQTFTGVVQGASIAGTFTQSGVKDTLRWKGTRAQVLSYGLAGKSPAEQKAWEERTRRQLHLLMMAGNPAPTNVKITVVQDSVPPFPSKKLPADRDDNPAMWPQNYKVSELNLDATLPNPYGGEALKRRIHAYLTVPTTPPPKGGKYPALVAINGHGGSAWKMLNPDDALYWYGDAFARRGFVVIAVDVSHRPTDDRRGLYPGGADDPTHGNGFHPAIKAPGFDSDWEEDGERAWDIMRTLDHLLARPDVDPKRVVATGLSMGGQLTTALGGLEPRIAVSIPVAFSTDMGVMQYHGNHACWRWLNADIHEYIDTSDFYCLTAPRPLIIQVGKKDATYSSYKPPFASDFQVVRRARVAFGGGPLFLYLHYDGHRFHAGDINPIRNTERGVLVPTLTGPITPGSLSWQTDATTKEQAGTLFELVQSLLK